MSLTEQNVQDIEKSYKEAAGLLKLIEDYQNIKSYMEEVKHEKAKRRSEDRRAASILTEAERPW